MKLITRATILGAVFGLIAPIVGLFFGLQVSTVLGNILTWPFILIVIVTGIPIGMWPVSLLLLGTVASVLMWAVIFRLLSRIRSYKHD